MKFLALTSAEFSPAGLKTEPQVVNILTRLDGVGLLEEFVKEGRVFATNLFDKFIRSSMNRGRTVLPYGLLMFGSAIALVSSKPVTRITIIHFVHQRVAEDLGNDRSGRDGEAERVTLVVARLRD